MCVICAVPVPLDVGLVSALKGLGLTPIVRSTSRCACSMRSWDPTCALLLGTQVEILYTLLATSVDDVNNWRRK